MAIWEQMHIMNMSKRNRSWNFLAGERSGGF